MLCVSLKILSANMAVFTVMVSYKEFCFLSRVSSYEQAPEYLPLAMFQPFCTDSCTIKDRKKISVWPIFT